MNITRLRELCDAFDKGALRGEEMRELVGLAREAASALDVPCCDGSAMRKHGCIWCLCSSCVSTHGEASPFIRGAVSQIAKRNDEHGVNWSITRGIYHYKPCVRAL